MKIKSNWKVVIWGHKINEHGQGHTHGWIHYSFVRAFKHLGIETHWHDDSTDQSNFDYTNTFFITEGQVCNNIPLRQDCVYVLHNCYDEKFKPLLESRRATKLQVYTDAVLNYSLFKKTDCTYYDAVGQCLYQPWATNLLPHEIEANKPNTPFQSWSRVVNWVGTVGSGEFGNIEQLDGFIRGCRENEIHFNHQMNTPQEYNETIIKISYMAPAIVGRWQSEVGYIPCRIFKNISYGQFGITNSARVQELFQNRIVYDPNTYRLFFEGRERLTHLKLEELHSLMDFVKDNHTYLNRIETILDFLSQMNPELIGDLIE